MILKNVITPYVIVSAIAGVGFSGDTFATTNITVKLANVTSWQMNRPMKDNAENILYSAKDYALAVLAIVDQVRAVIKAQKPDAVVLGETTAGPIARHWDGGLNADFGFGKF